jgi:rubredoxin
MNRRRSGLPETKKLSRRVCLECHYIYDPAKGDPRGGILPGVAFEDLPDTWRCPECKILKVKKGVFKHLDD